MEWNQETPIFSIFYDFRPAAVFTVFGLDFGVFDDSIVFRMKNCVGFM